MPKDTKLATIQLMNIGFLGVDYQSAELNDLESIVFNQNDIASFYNRCNSEPNIHEAVVLSTCNRVEIYFNATQFEDAVNWIKAFLVETHNMTLPALNKLLVEAHGPSVIDHLFRVTAGIESMVLGENEILGQVKNAYEFACQCGSTGPQLNKIFQMAVAVGKRVRKETHISQGAYSVSSIAVDAVKEKYRDENSNPRILIVGAGTMALRAIKKLVSLGWENIWITNRSEDKLNRLAQKYNIEVLSFHEFKQHLDDFDTMIVAVSRPDYMITYDDLKHTISRSKTIIDLGVPRNVDPKSRELDLVSLLTMDELKEVADQNLKKRHGEVDKVHEIIKDELGKLLHWHQVKRNLWVPRYA